MVRNKRIGNRCFHEVGSSLFEAWYSNRENVYQLTINRYKDNRRNEELRWCFDYNGRTYTEDCIVPKDEYRSNLADLTEILGVCLREVF